MDLQLATVFGSEKDRIYSSLLLRYQEELEVCYIMSATHLGCTNFLEVQQGEQRNKGM